MSHADDLFIKNVKDILDKGVSDEGQEVRPRWEDGTPAHTIALFGVVDRYDLAKEFPILTVRRTFWKSAWDEISWIWQKKSNRISELKSHVWDSWADENGTIGKAYGYQMGILSRYKDITKEGLRKAFGDSLDKRTISLDSDGVYRMDQVDRVIYQLVNDPASRRILTNLYNHQDLSEMALSPCAYSMTFNVMDGKLHAILNQRSQDMITANSWNTVQAALLVYCFASAYGYEPGELVHMIANCHIYDRHIPLAEKLIQAETFSAPKFEIDPNIRDFYDFTVDSFTLTDYRYSEFKDKIPVAI
ncbi:MAG: thymidylate synthase [Lachnospiraceae bacterium]|nr:thymidylate synthase [Lachnospiraceae bacterium]